MEHSLGTHDPQAAERYFLPPGYVARHSPAFYRDNREPEIEYQPGVYSLARRLVRRGSATTIVDVGCGHARKLARLYPAIDIVGIDIGENIEYCRETYDFGEWLEHDLDGGEPLPVTSAVLREAILVCADVVEHLVHPDRALRALREAAAHSRGLLISTPDRDRTENERAIGPPTNPSHAREWTRDEFAALLDWCGFRGGYLTHTRARTGSLSFETLLYVNPSPSAP